MKPLILKDLYTQKLFAYLFPIFLLLPFYYNATHAFNELDFVSFYVAFAAIWMSVYSNFGTKTVNMQEQKLFSSLPVTRQKIVLAKYCAALMWWGIAFVVYGTLAFLISVWSTNSVSFNGVFDLILSPFVTLAIVSIFYPLYFLVGYQIAVFISISIPMIWFFLLTFTTIDSDGTMQVSPISTGSPLVFFSIIVASMIITFFSFKLSVKVFEKKDL
ncbi:ABC-2 transporter permease [Lederbergia panacisoli]|uniref:ABC-2 transporter permease n=1 Tax=Lederbergia panacisoli TaxID=1255251 RepID=UPI00214B6FF5|nr:ABC-2 transporter permease [Lederbergia panacisoli]MCR2822129.1 ABC-2 transporter permease [Lederbergia panacisoli]